MIDAWVVIVVVIGLMLLTGVILLWPWYKEDRRKRKALEAAQREAEDRAQATRHAEAMRYRVAAREARISALGVPVHQSTAVRRGTMVVTKDRDIVKSVAMHPDDSDALLPALLSPTWAPSAPAAPPPPEEPAWKGDGGSFTGAGASGSWDPAPTASVTEAPASSPEPTSTTDFSSPDLTSSSDPTSGGI